MTISLRLTDEVMRAFPETQICLVNVLGMRNDEPWDETATDLQRLEDDVAHGRWQPYTEDHLVIASWFEAYRAFGTNPRRSRPSIDALSRRVSRDGKLPQINPAVDSYNGVSVRFGTPSGAFDIDALEGPVLIRFAKAGDTFIPLGEPDKVEEPKPGEVVYAQNSRILTRHWNHRDTDKTKVTEDTRNAVFIIERVSKVAVSDDRLSAAQTHLVNLLKPHTDEIILHTLNASTPIATLTTNFST